jgi:hypothetical protein
MAWKTLTHALDQLIFDGLPVVRDLKGAVDELKAAWQASISSWLRRSCGRRCLTVPARAIIYNCWPVTHCSVTK